MAVIVAAFLYGERKEALQRAMRSADALVGALGAHTARTYQAVDITLAGVADALRMAPGLQRDDPEFRQALRRRLEALQPYARAIFVIGPSGRLLHDSYYPSAPNASAEDRNYFQAHRNDPALESAIWPPLRSRFRDDWFLAVTRRVGDDAKFRGIVVASLEPRYFDTLFRGLGLDNVHAIMLNHLDGTLIARHPYQEDQVGRSFADSTLFTQHLPRAATGSYITRSGMFSFERLVSYRVLEGMPLVVTVGQSTQTILEPWRETALGAVLALGALLLLLAALVAQFLRQQRIRDLARERRLQSEKLEALGHLTGGVSHDFANLLNVVSASLRILQAESKDAPRIREALAVGERAIVRGTQLVDQLRAFSRRQPLHIAAADLNLLVDTGIELLRQVTGPGVKLQTALAASVTRCLLDETELEVALVNLLVNAKDAGASRIILKTYNCTEEAKPAGWRGGHAADYVCLSVIDDGPGMTEHVRRRAFEPYFSTKGKAGTGLGLAQVYGFLRQVGGDVHIESQPGKGTQVHLLFPKAVEDTALEEQALVKH
jgi:signal transduction histidine kinase